MARRIGDNEFALFGREEAVGDINRNALFALGGQAIDQERKINLAALGPDPLGIGFERGQLILENHFGIIEQPPNQGRFAIINTAAGDETQQALVLMLQQIGVYIGFDQVGNMGH